MEKRVATSVDQTSPFRVESWLCSFTDASGIGAPDAILGFRSQMSTTGSRSSTRTTSEIGGRSIL